MTTCTITPTVGASFGSRFLDQLTRFFSRSVVTRDAIDQAKTSKEPIHLLVQSEDYIRPVNIDYHDGQRFPVLVRDASKKDYLDEITTPLTEDAKKSREQAATHTKTQND